MMKAVVLFCVAALVGLFPFLSSAAQRGVYEAKPVTVTATIEAIDKATRVVTLKGPKGNSMDVKTSDQMEGFGRLKVGDQVSATYFEAIVLEMGKPGSPPSSSAPVTSLTRKDRKPGAEARREQTVTVTIQAIDATAPSVTVKGPEGRVLTLPVGDPKQLQNVKVGDTVAVRYFESLLINVTPAPKKE
jgi:hypothetical protein